MRIISGTYKGRTLQLPSNFRLRPTTDFAKTGLFNVLNNQFDFEAVRVLDLFAGTGSISYEFVSRGCRDITSVDISQHAYSYIRETMQSLGIPNAHVLKADVFRFLEKSANTYDVIFADPPYDMKEAIELPALILDQKKMLRPGGWLIVEHASRNTLDQHTTYKETRKYGNVSFSIFEA